VEDELQLNIQPKTLGKRIHIWSERFLGALFVLGALFALLSEIEWIKESVNVGGLVFATLVGVALFYTITYRVFFIFNSRVTKYFIRPIWAIFLIFMLIVLASEGYRHLKEHESNKSTQAIRTAARSSCLV